MNIQKIMFLKLRFVMSFIFLWAFFDKVFGLGFATGQENAWINGGSPTYGFLTHAVRGPLAPFFQSLAGMPIVDWSFMLGLLFVGLTLLFNRFVFLGSLSGIIMMILMWSAVFPPENNPIIDDHIVYAIVLAILAVKSRDGELKIKSQ